MTRLPIITAAFRFLANGQRSFGRHVAPMFPFSPASGVNLRRAGLSGMTRTAIHVPPGVLTKTGDPRGTTKRPNTSGPDDIVGRLWPGTADPPAPLAPEKKSPGLTASP